MPIFRKTDHAPLKLRLAKARPMTSLIDMELAVANGEIVRERSNWVPMWVDEAHAVRSDCRVITAQRAITDHGQFLWFVRHRDKTHGYHAPPADPFDAIAEAEAAWDARRRVKRQWDDIRALARRLRRGQESMVVRIEDAHNSALCTMGIEGFLRSVGMSQTTAISGRTAAYLMLLEPQLGFVLHEAKRRTEAERNRAADPQQAEAGRV